MKALCIEISPVIWRRKDFMQYISFLRIDWASEASKSQKYPTYSSGDKLLHEILSSKTSSELTALYTIVAFSTTYHPIEESKKEGMHSNNSRLGRDSKWVFHFHCCFHLYSDTSIVRTHNPRGIILHRASLALKKVDNDSNLERTETIWTGYQIFKFRNLYGCQIKRALIVENSGI